VTDAAMPANPAAGAAERARAAMLACIDRGESFVLEAGAGAGKTHSLVEALKFLIKRDGTKLRRRHQRIACITFTNAAKDQIEARTDKSPLIYCDTIHAFCWSLIGGFQKQLRERLPQIERWPERVNEAGGLGGRLIEYTLGHPGIKEDRVSIYHDDVLLLTVRLMENAKFRRILSDKFPVILIDEYQDADAGWIESVKTHFLGQPGSPQFGFFGDHWQKIYGNGCGSIDSPALAAIGKGANFRSAPAIVDCLNRMRPELTQSVADPAAAGSVRVFHTNSWRGERLNGQHWGGDLPPEAAHAALASVQERLAGKGWDLSPAGTKILMLTHRVLASEQGYGSLPNIFRFNEAFAKKEHPHIAFFADILEPACNAFIAKRYGEMFAALGGDLWGMRCQADKSRWSDAMGKLVGLRASGTVGGVIAHLRQRGLPALPRPVEELERELERVDRTPGNEVPPALDELEKLHGVRYQEIVALSKYLGDHSPFQTKHGVKGAEFENVIVVVGRGWNQYNFNEMLELARDTERIPAGKRDAFERNRNLFYVACSRPKKRLALLFTQKLSAAAMRTVEEWFGRGAVEPLTF
jgi:DNA helicase-2/ATP-dependent DNA helicase PcrA